MELAQSTFSAASLSAPAGLSVSLPLVWWYSPTRLRKNLILITLYWSFLFLSLFPPLESFFLPAHRNSWHLILGIISHRNIGWKCRKRKKCQIFFWVSFETMLGFKKVKRLKKKNINGQVCFVLEQISETLYRWVHQACFEFPPIIVKRWHCLVSA